VRGGVWEVSVGVTVRVRKKRGRGKEWEGWTRGLGGVGGGWKGKKGVCMIWRVGVCVVEVWGVKTVH